MKVRIFQDNHQKRRLGSRKCPWSVEWRENGRRRSKVIGTKKEDAERFATVKRAELIDGAMGITTRKRWSDFLAEYDRLKIGTMRSHNSRRMTRQILRRFGEITRPTWVSGIDAKALDEYVSKRLAMPSRNGDKVSPESVRKELRHIRAALNVAKEWRYIRDVPRMPNPKGHASDKRFVTEDHFDAIMAACDGAKLPDPRIHHGIEPAIWWRALLATAWVSGVRIGALLALRWGDVDLDRGVVWSRARDNKAKRDTRHSIGGALKWLRALPQADPRVFPWNHHGRTLWLEFARIQKAAGIDLPCPQAANPDHECTDACHLYGFHDVRRAHATYNYGKVPDRALQQQMGHASFQTTHGYIRYAELHQADAYPAHLPASLQDGKEAAKEREKSGTDDGKPKLRVLVG